MKKSKKKNELKIQSVSEDTLEFLSLDDETIEAYGRQMKSAHAKKKNSLHKKNETTRKREVYAEVEEEDEEEDGRYYRVSDEEEEEEEDDDRYYRVSDEEEEDEEEDDDRYYRMRDEDEDEDDEEYYEIDDEYYEDEDDEDDEEEDGIFARFGEFLANMSSLDHVVMMFGCFILIAAVATGIIFVGSKITSKQVEAFAEIGKEIEQIGVIGEGGLVAVSNAESTRLSQMFDVEQDAGNGTGTGAEGGGGSQNTVIAVNMKLNSIKSDIKIKFVNSQNNKLINSVPFEVEITGDNGKTYQLKDEDKDGIIYQTGVNAGNYTVKAIALTGEEYAKYQMPSPGTIQVTEAIAYKKVDVADEIKTEAEVNVAIEDTAQQNTVIESTLTNTVEWVESTKTEKDADNNYQEIKKTDIPDPSTLAMTGGFAKMVGITARTVDPGDTGNTGGTGDTGNTGGSGDTGNTGNTGDTENPDGTDKPDKPENPDETGKPENPDNPNPPATLTDQEKLDALSPKLSSSSLSLTKGEDASLSIQTTGNESYSVTWSSSNDSVASVSGSGTVSAKGAGSATVTAKIEVGAASTQLSCSVTVKEEVAQPSDRDKLDALRPVLSATSLSLTKGGDAALTISTTGNESYSVTWSSSNDSIASVDNSGKVVAKAVGSATVTAKVQVGEASTQLNCLVTVGDAVLTDKQKLEALKPTLSNTSLALTKGGEAALSISVTGNEPYTVTWGSDNDAVASVTNSGKVTAKAVGTAKVTAKIQVGKESVDLVCTVTVGDLTDKQKLDALKPTLNTTTLTLTKGGSAALSISVTGKEAYTVTWSSDNATIASVNNTGTVKGEKIGTAKITAKIKVGTAALDLVCNVTVSDVKYTALKIEGSSSIQVGKTGTVKGTTTPAGGTVSWTSDNEKVVKIDSKGTMTGVSVGTATITGTCGDAKNTWKVTVVKDVSGDTKTKLKDRNGNQIYVKTKEGKYIEAVYADYYKDQKLYLRKGNASYVYTGWQTIDGGTYFFDKNGNYVTGEQVIQGAKYSFGSDGRLSTGSGAMGIDVSKWNGSIDWNAVKNSGVSYVIIRCGYRGSSSGALIEDPKFRSNIQGAKDAGLKVGVYFFSQAVNEVEAVEEASMAINLVNGYGLNYPIFLDVEASGGRGDKVDAATRTAVCKAFCNTIQNSGYTAGIYANKTWFESYIQTGSLTGYKIWLAQYASSPTYTATRYDMWQYSSKGKVSGINGSVDMNISYMNY